ncbi:hypothetical protein ACI789_00305 [Geodermatophilus sp. SYSU D00965]
MTVVETILVYVVAPLAVVLLLALLTLAPGARRRRPRYKPGQPWEHEPVWYEPHPQGGGGHGPAEAHGPAAVPGDGTTALGSSMYPEQHGGAPALPQGGHGGGGHTPSPAAVASARPYGGARGTW